MNGLLFVLACFLLLSLIGSFSVYYCGLPKDDESDINWVGCMNIFNVISCGVVIAASWSLMKSEVPVKFWKQ